jgi:acyl-CoA thioesterase-1
MMNHVKYQYKWIIVCFFIPFFFGCGNQKNENADKPIIQKPIQETTKSTPGLKKEVILFFGNSLTAGYGLEENQAFTALIQDRIDSLNLNYQVVNAGLSGETTAGGLGRIDWVLEQPIDIFVLELGGNDMLRGFNIEATESNLRAIIKKVKAKNAKIQIIIAGMQAPPNMGKDYTDRFEKIYFQLADEYQTGLIPFLLKDVGGIKSLNQSDGIHPNAEGQKVLRENVWQELKKFL